jgi:hypothetical protein
MCEPTTLAYIGLAVSVAGAGVSYEQQRGTASRQTDAINKNNELEQNDLSRQADQARAASAAEMNAHSQQAAKDAALFDVITGEYGGGKTASRTAAIGSVQNGEALSTISSNASNRLGEIGFQSYGAGARSASQLASLSHPSLVGTALQIGSAAVKAQTQIDENRLVPLTGKR